MSIKKAMLGAVLLCLVGFESAGAATLTATTTGPNGSFVIDFNDANNNFLFDLSELTSFSGFTSTFGQGIVSVIGVPEISGISVAGFTPGASIYDITWWNFEELGLIDLEWDLASVTSNWTYEVSGLAPVPLPAALPLFAVGLGALGFTGWRRKRKTIAA